MTGNATGRGSAQDSGTHNNPFHLNLEQQKKRAKDLARAFKAGDPDAFDRFSRHHPRFDRDRPDNNRSLATLSEAQLVIARELRLPSWPKLKSHIAALDRAQTMIAAGTAADEDARTLHIRCGSDLKRALEIARFSGDFFEYSNPFCQGPVTDNPGWLSERVDFIASAYGEHMARFYGDEFIRSREEIAKGMARDEETLRSSAKDYQRIVLWFEHDTYDILILMRLLAYFHEFGVPDILELIQLNSFPGTRRFVGLGELPPVALRHIWNSRRPVTDDQLALGQNIWRALRSPDPTGLHRLAQSGTPALPDCSIALKRHLQELPHVNTGLALTERLILQILADEPRTAGRTFGALTQRYEPLPFLGDLMFLHIVLETQKTDQPTINIEIGPEPGRWPTWQLSITPLGKAVLAGEVDFLSLNPPTRWVGGIQIIPGKPAWRWDAKSASPTKH